MLRDAPFLNDNIYHVYNRGAHKANIFIEDVDYERFKLLLFLANSKNPIHLANLLKRYQNQGRTFISIYENEEVSQDLVDVLSYALMPNHFHLILRQRHDNGITDFLRKVSTAYTMYFNKKKEHSGTVFQGKFKSKHVHKGDYLRWLFSYVALNPLDIKFPGWKEGRVNQRDAHDFLLSYRHASYPDLSLKVQRPEHVIISFPALNTLSEDVPDFSNVRSLFEINQNYSK